LVPDTSEEIFRLLIVGCFQRQRGGQTGQIEGAKDWPQGRS